jgi:lysyl-tRNA synthetase class 2
VVADLEHLSDEMKVRREKIGRIREKGMQPFAERYERTHTIGESAELADGVAGVRIAGRIVALRYFGKLAFGHLFDSTGKVQFALQRNQLEDRFALFKQIVDVGDFVGIEGEMFTTRTGEKTVNAHSWTFLSKSLRPLPEKFHGLADQEQKMRRRYLDLISSPDAMSRFQVRTRIIRTLRAFLDENGFTEIDTPVLANKASGALATPFSTHYDALDIDVYMRIAPETYLKRAIAGGFDRVYEFARCFRNEGIDPSHLPDFTMLEYYASYWNSEDSMDFTERMIKHLVQTVTGGLKVDFAGTSITFDKEWSRLSFRDLILKDSGIDIDIVRSKDEMIDAIKQNGITFEAEIDFDAISRGTLIDQLYKKVSRPKIVEPTFLIRHPIDISPLARRNDEDELVVDRFQLVVNGWEIVNAYSELIDPIDQAERFSQQAAARAAGDEEAMEIDNDYVLCMEYGMPPISGWGMGIDRIVALLTGVDNLRDVVLFPLLRPE